MQHTPPECIHQSTFLGLIKVKCIGDTKYTPMHVCNVFGRCLPKFKGPWTEDQRHAEGAMFHLCHSRQSHCDRYEEKVQTV